MDYTLLLSEKLNSCVLRKESPETDCRKSHSQFEVFGKHKSPAISHAHTSGNRHKNLKNI